MKAYDRFETCSGGYCLGEQQAPCYVLVLLTAGAVVGGALGALGGDLLIGGASSADFDLDSDRELKVDMDADRVSVYANTATLTMLQAESNIQGITEWQDTSS